MTAAAASVPRRIAVLFGTRPEAIKMAPVVLELTRRLGREAVRVVVTAQHRQMLDQVLALFSIRPDHDLDIMRPGQSLFEVTARVLTGLEPVLAAEEPDLLLVQGDTTSVFVGALAAFYCKIPVGHVEAGLRTGDRYSPFPEEVNRRLASVLTELHFAPTERARDNLLREGVAPGKIFVTGNTVIDALLATVRRDYRFGPEHGLGAVDFARRLIVVTAHRRESFGEPFRGLCRGLAAVADRFEDVQIVYPVHLNPNVQAPVNEILGRHPRIHLVPPLDYEPFVQLLDRATLILTDSGGIQEEAPSLGKPVLVLRENTERPEAVDAGTVRLVGTDPDRILAESSRLLTDATAYEAMARAINPYGDGHAAARIADVVLRARPGTSVSDEP